MAERTETTETTNADGSVTVTTVTYDANGVVTSRSVAHNAGRIKNLVQGRDMSNITLGNGW